MNTGNDLWIVEFSSKARKQKIVLPQDIGDILASLVKDLTYKGPVQPKWKNYGKLKGKKGEFHHCHLCAGHPTYVVVWQVFEQQLRVIEIRFIGTHEKVNYDRFN